MIQSVEVEDKMPQRTNSDLESHTNTGQTRATVLLPSCAARVGLLTLSQKGKCSSHQVHGADNHYVKPRLLHARIYWMRQLEGSISSVICGRSGDPGFPPFPKTIQNTLKLSKWQTQMATVKQIMEEAVTRKFVHEDSSHIISFCARTMVINNDGEDEDGEDDDGEDDSDGEDDDGEDGDGEDDDGEDGDGEDGDGEDDDGDGEDGDGGDDDDEEGDGEDDD
ncbi:hypothetical protein STEG23_031476, partial [Scotinomys teguina]